MSKCPGWYDQGWAHLYSGQAHMGLCRPRKLHSVFQVSRSKIFESYISVLYSEIIAAVWCFYVMYWQWSGQIWS